MYATSIAAVLVASLLVAPSVYGKPFRSLDGRGPSFGFSSARFPPSHANFIGNQNGPFPHSSNNFNPLSSSLVWSSQPTFRPSFRPVSFGRPLPINNFRVPRNPANQNTGISFGNNNPFQQGGSLNAGAIQFGRPINNPVSFSNKPTQVVLPSQPAKSPGGSPSNNPVIFPGGATDTTTDFNLENIGETPDCLLKHGTVNFGGNCEVLLSRASCPEDHWLLIDVNGSPYCAERQCPWGQLRYLGNCVDPADTKVCNRGQILYVDFTGYVECDCEPNFMFDSVSGNCYGVHEQGFCSDGFYLEKDTTGIVSCVPNPCVSDNKVEKDGICYEKNYRGFCSPSQVTILQENFTADCQFVVPHSIFQVPSLTTCPPGSRRDFFNKCRGVFRVPSQSSFPTLRGDCPTDFVKDPQGTCRKVVNLFG